MRTSVSRLRMLRNRVLPVLAGVLSALLALWVVLAPAENRLGNLIKLVYVHGALVGVGLISFTVAGVLGLVALLSRQKVWYRGTEAAGQAALIIWVAYVLSSMVVTKLTWGQLIAWNEPRVRATGLILGAVIIMMVLVRFVDHRDFMAVVQLLLGIAPWIVVRQAQAIRHPVDPIGTSGSSAIQTYYLLIFLTVLGLASVLVAWLWVAKAIAARTGPGQDAARVG